MAYWLLKSEPGEWSWDDQRRAGTAEWDGVRNAQAMNNMKAMRPGDRCFFYHSGEERRVVGVVEVTRAWYPDPADDSGKYGLVDIAAGPVLPRPVTLAEVKANPKLSTMWLVRHTRLSVAPVAPAEWREVCRMGGLKP